MTDFKQGHTVDPSDDEPQYLVESAKTGEEAAHKADALKKAYAVLRRDFLHGPDRFSKDAWIGRVQRDP